jgi:protein-S-isoprenylcysteine O-methyltransferase Ste14
VQRQERVDAEPLAVVGGLSLLLVFWVGLGFGGSGWPVAGGLAMIAGIALRIAAIRALGPWFASTSRWLPGQPEIRTGVYGRLRHPSELGLLLLAFGAAILLGSRAALAVALLVVLPASVMRVLREERPVCYDSAR